MTCLLSPAPPAQHYSHVLRLQTITPEGSAKHLWTHGMVTRYGHQDAEDVPDTQVSSPLHLAPQDLPMVEGENN